MPLTPAKEPGFVNAAQAARLMGITARHVYRLIENGYLVARHRNKRRLEIALVDVEAWIEAHPREVNPLEKLKGLYDQFQQVLQRIGELETHFNAFRTSTQEELAALREEIQRDELQQALNHLLTVFARLPEQECRLDKEKIDEDGYVPTLSRLGIDLQEYVRRALSATERRQLPSGTVTIASFAKKHTVKPRTAIDHCKKTTATRSIVVQRQRS
jgi:Helix-turn-helix domain